MKQLGNLSIVCAKRPDVLMQVYGGRVSGRRTGARQDGRRMGR